MGQKQDWLRLAAPMQAYHQVLLISQRPDDVDVFSRKARVAKTRGHGLSRPGHIADRGVSGVDLNELFENVMGDLVFRSKRLLLGQAAGDRGDYTKEDT